MESLLGLVGLVCLIFFVLATAVEAILEMFRGSLEFFGITFLKGKYSIDDALSLANEFVPNKDQLNNDALRLKLEAVKGATLQLEAKSKEKVTLLTTLQNDIVNAVGQPASDVSSRLNAIASEVRLALDGNESKRVFILRILSAIIGCGIVYSAGFMIFPILASAPGAPELLQFNGYNNIAINVIAGGLGAAAGSSYWHDNLDKIRNLKSAQRQVTALAR